MDTISRTELKTLLETTGKHCVSVFLPTHRGGVEVQQDPIRLKNLLRRAEDRLAESGVRPAEIKELLDPAQKLVGDTLFWRHQGDGLALFLRDGAMQRWRLPVHFEELAVLQEGFHVKPLLPLMTGDGRFYVLALSQRHVRLLRGTRQSVGEMDVPGLPRSLEEALPPNEHEVFLRGEVDSKEEIQRFFREVDRALRPVLREEHAPMVLAGVEYLHPIYREANTYAHLLAEGIEGNPDLLSAQSLHAAAWKRVEPQFLKAQQEAVERYNQMASTPRTSHNIKDIVLAAHQGRVDTLFVAVDHRRWGTVDTGSGAVEMHLAEQPGDEDLLDVAATRTFLNGGKVFALPFEQMPDRVILAALYRY